MLSEPESRSGRFLRNNQENLGILRAELMRAERSGNTPAIEDLRQKIDIMQRLERVAAMLPSRPDEASRQLGQIVNELTAGGRANE